MIFVITPPVGSGQKYAKIKNIARLLSFGIATVIGAAVVGSICGVIGAVIINRIPILRVGTLGIIVSIALLYGFAELRGRKQYIPTCHRLVPKRWGAYGSPRFEIAFGIIVGAGLFTVIPFIGFHLLLIICFVNADPMQGALSMAVFGAARAAPALFTPLFLALRHRTYTSLMAIEANQFFDKMDRNLAWVRAATLLGIASSVIVVSLARF